MTIDNIRTEIYESSAVCPFRGEIRRPINQNAKVLSLDIGHQTAGRTDHAECPASDAGQRVRKKLGTAPKLQSLPNRP